MDNLTLALKLAGKETTTEQRSEQANPSSASIVYMIAVTSSSNGEVVLKDEIETDDEWEDAIEIDDDGDFEEYEPEDPLEDVDDSVVDMTDGDGVDIEDTEHETVSFSVGDYHEAAVAAYEEENEVSEDDLPDEDASISDDIDDGDAEEIPDVGVVDEDELTSDDETVSELSDSDYTLQDGDSNDISDDVEGAEISDGYTIAECIGSIKAGDRVAVAIQDGKPVVIGVVGSGDEQLALMKHAQEAADEASEMADSAQTQANEALEAANNANTKVDEAVQAAAAATESAEKAHEAAVKAESAVGAVEQSLGEIEASISGIESTVAGAKESAETAVAKAEEAKTASQNAQEDASEAAAAVITAQNTADTAIANAAVAVETAGTAKGIAESASEIADAIKQDVQAAEEEIAGLHNSLETLSNTMQTDYVRDTDLSTVQANLQTQISQNAAQIESTASKVTEVDETSKQAAADAKELAEAAQSAATEAQEQAAQATADAAAAQSAADEAAQAATNAQTEADNAKAAAQAADSKAAQAVTDLATAQQNLDSVTSRVGATEEEIAAAQAAVETAQAAADKAKADAVEAATKAANAQTTANTAVTNAQNAQSAADDAAQAAAAAQATANAAGNAAAAAQAKADAAAATAQAAQETADTAKANAQAAQNKANDAAAAAQTAQNAANAADAKAQQAAADLVTAQQNLATVKSRVDATEEEIAAAEQAVANAQKAADDADAAAKAAQNTANQAKQDAATAQTAADNAKTAADNAQDAADEAKAAADKAQEDVNALAKRVTTAETKITQNSEQISLMATKTEVAETLGGYTTKDEMNAALTVKANEINLSVSTNYATKTALAETDSNISEHSEQLEDHETRISANEDAITLKVSSAEFNSYKTTVTNNISTAKTEAINAAATDATTKANNAKSQAISSAASDATNKANSAKADAIAEAAEDATEKADAAEAAAISAAATDATSKANAAKSAAISTAATDATTKANNAKSEAITAAATDATNKANAALEDAKDYTDEEVGAVTTEVTNVKKTVAEHTTSLSSITSRVATTETNITTINGDITSLEERMNAAELKITADAIISTVSGTYLKKTDASSTYATKTEVTQTASGLEAKITNAQNTANSASTAAGTAQSTANAARTEAANAAKTATNYLGFSSNGLVVGDMTASTLGNNVLIHTAGVDIRNNDTVLASYQANAIYLGQNNKDTVIYLCNGLAHLGSYVDNDDWNRFLISSDDAIYLVTSGELQQSVAYSPDYGVTEYFSTIRMTSHRPWLESNEMDGLPVIQLSSSVTSDDVSAVGSIYVTKDYLKLISEDHYGVKAYIDIMSANLKSVISISALEVEVGKSTENDILLKINEGGIATYTDVNVGGKRYNDGIQGVYIASDGFIQIQRNHSSYNPYISFHLNGNDTSTADAQICVQQSSGTMDFLRAEGYYFDNEVNVDSLYTQGDVKIGGKGYNDGNAGIYMDAEGFIQIQRNHSDYHPYISFYLNGNDTSTADGQIRVNQSTSYMQFLQADAYEFDKAIYAYSFYVKAGMRLGDDANVSTSRVISTYWKDGATHYILERGSDGLTTAVGWAGSSSYATVTKIRGRTCQYQNSSGTSTLSDERLKKDFVELDAWSEFYDALQPCAFRMKNGTSGRYHMGFKAQQVEQALIDAGLSTNDFAGFIKLKHMIDVDDPEGNAVYEEAGINEGDDEFGLIYSEFTALNTYQIQQLKKEKAAQDKKIAELETLVNQLLPI